MRADNPGIPDAALAARGRRPLRCEVVDGPRGYQDESDGRWYPGFTERYPDPESRYDEDRYRTPEPRYSEEPSGDLGRYRDRPDPLTDPALASRPLGPRSGVELPPPLPGDPAERFGAEPRFGTEPIDRSALRRPPAGPAPARPVPAQAPRPLRRPACCRRCRP